MDVYNGTLNGDYAETYSPATDYYGIRAQNNSSQVPGMPVTVFTVVSAVLHILVFIVGLLGNSLVIYVVVRYTKMKTVTNLYILNLALADEIYILGIPFLCTHNVLSYWPYGEFLCKMYMTADIMSQFSSTFCLTVMSIDRYLAVVHPMKSYKWRKPQVAKILNALMWVVSFLIALPVTFFSNIQEGFNSCNITWPNTLWSNVFILYTAILGFFGPVVVICLCYLLLVIKVRSAGARAGLTRLRQSERKATRMVVVIVLVFVFCWLPFFTTQIVNLVYTIPENDIIATIYFITVILTYVNSAANPILYGFLSNNFKQSFRKALCVANANEVYTPDQALTPNLDRSRIAKAPASPARSQVKNGTVQNRESAQLERISQPDNDQLKSSML